MQSLLIILVPIDDQIGTSGISWTQPVTVILSTALKKETDHNQSTIRASHGIRSLTQTYLLAINTCLARLLHLLRRFLRHLFRMQRARVIPDYRRLRRYLLPIKNA